MTYVLGAATTLQSFATKAGSWLSQEMTVIEHLERDLHFLSTERGMQYLDDNRSFDER